VGQAGMTVHAGAFSDQMAHQAPQSQEGKP